MLEILVNTFISLFKKLGGVKKLLTLIKTEKKTLIAIILWSMIIIPLTTFICYVFFKIITIQVNHDSKNPIAISRKEDFDETLILLSSAKKEIFDFFDNVKVNDESAAIKKNRLELINILCKSFENYTDFHLIEDINE